MKFGNPLFLFGLFALLIPVIIHLFNFRRFKKVYFSDITFLKELKEQTQSKNKLKNYLILLSRLFFIALLVLAFAQPFIPNGNVINAGAKLISVYVDNSFSMNANGEQGRLLDVAKKAALEIAGGYKETDRFQLLTNDFEGKHQRFYTRDEFIKLVEEVKESPSTKNISEILTRQKNAFNQYDPSFKSTKHNFLLSDFQKSMVINDQIKADSLITHYFVPLQSNEVNNIYIDSVWFDQPVFRKEETNLLSARIVNNSTEILENKPLNLFIDNKSVVIATLNIPANSDAVVQLPVNIKAAGLVNAYLSFDDYPINYDDKFYFSFMVYDKLNVLLINGKNASNYLNTLLSNDAFYNLTVLNEQQIKVSELNAKQLIILNEVNELSGALVQEIKKVTENGSHALIIPSENYNQPQFTSLSEMGLPWFAGSDTGNFILEKPDLKNHFFKAVFDEQKISKNEKLDLPLVKFKYSLKQGLNERSEVILNFVNSEPYLLAQSLAKGKIYALTSPLNLKYNTLAKHSLFVPVIYKIALGSLSVNQLYYKIGNAEKRTVVLNEKNENEVLKIKSIGKNSEVIPQQSISNSGVSILVGDLTINEPGNFSVVNINNIIVDGVSLNYNRSESDLKFLSEEELKEYALKNNFKLNVLPPRNTDFTHLVKQESEGKKLWKWCVVLALIGLISETLLIKYLK